MPISSADVAALKKKTKLLPNKKAVPFFYFDKGTNGRTPILLMGMQAKQEKEALKKQAKGNIFHGRVKRVGQVLTFKTVMATLSSTMFYHGDRWF